MMKALKGLSLFVGLAVVLTLFLVIGCSNKSPVQPLDPNTPELGKLPPPVIIDPGNDPQLEVYDQGLISSVYGGTIEIERGDFTHQFVVDPYALRQTTLITVRSINEEVLGREMIVFEFGPDGLEFLRSAHLQFEAAELEGITSTARMYYYDTDKNTWELLDTVNVENGIAEFAIDHFSKYAISD